MNSADVIERSKLTEVESGLKMNSADVIERSKLTGVENELGRCNRT